MKVLIALKELEAMERYMEYKREEMQIQLVDRKDMFDLHISYPVDVICVDTRLFTDVYPWVWMEQIKTYNKKASVYIALDVDTYDTSMLSIIEKLSTDYGFTLIPTQVTAELITYEFAKRVFDIDRQSPASSPVGAGKFITVLPATSQ